LRRLAKTEAGFGLIELLIAMTVMVIAIMGTVAVFSSGLVALRRASHASTAATLADKQMESFREMAYASIAPTCAAGTLATSVCPSSVSTTGSDGRTYRIDTAAGFYCAVGTLGGTVPSSASCTGTGASRPEKLVTIVVYDPTTSPATQLFSETSTFDQATG
jgi:type II secretory pathway pseudopilin PulG